MKRLPKTNRDDPHPYEGPIEKADGTRPWNMFLWPTESWHPGHERQFQSVAGSFSFGYVALKDGQFSTEGSVYGIEKNCGSDGRPCIFTTRAQAIRTSAARMILDLRAAMKRHEAFSPDCETLEKVVNWTLKKVAEVTSAPAPKAIHIRTPKAEPPPGCEAGLPLFESAKRARA
jgi:hypothetical protein